MSPVCKWSCWLDVASEPSCMWLCGRNRIVAMMPVLVFRLPFTRDVRCRWQMEGLGALRCGSRNMDSNFQPFCIMFVVHLGRGKIVPTGASPNVALETGPFERTEVHLGLLRRFHVRPWVSSTLCMEPQTWVSKTQGARI